jgi:hypothetical protein
MKDLDALISEMRESEPYFSDNGFTAAVMAQIPTTRAVPLWKENAIMLAATAAGSAIAAWQIASAGVGQMLPDVSITMGTTHFAVAALAVYAFVGATMWVARREVI